MLIAIDTLSATPLYEQLRDQIVMGIASGRLAEGEALPSVRRLAADLGINFHTVNKGYSLLCDGGYIVMDRRKGAVVAQTAKGDENFRTELTRKVRLASAEAVCHGMGLEEFVRICTDGFTDANKNLGGAL
jgi:DNA-binding transcriptional regulator YhcF (GntR family)